MIFLESLVLNERSTNSLYLLIRSVFVSKQNDIFTVKIGQFGYSRYLYENEKICSYTGSNLYKSPEYIGDLLLQKFTSKFTLKDIRILKILRDVQRKTRRFAWLWWEKVGCVVHSFNAIF